MPPEKPLADMRRRLRHQSNKKLLKPLVDEDEESFDAMDLDLTQVMGPTQGHEKKKKGKRQVPPKDVGKKKNEQQTKKASLHIELSNRFTDILSSFQPAQPRLSRIRKSAPPRCLLVMASRSR